MCISIRDVMGLNLSAKMTPIQIVQALLDKLGRKLARMSKYTLCADDDQFDLPAGFELPEDLKYSSQRCYSTLQRRRCTTAAAFGT